MIDQSWNDFWFGKLEEGFVNFGFLKGQQSLETRQTRERGEVLDYGNQYYVQIDQNL